MTEAVRPRGRGASGNDTAMARAGQRSPIAATTRRRRAPGLRCGRRPPASCEPLRPAGPEMEVWARPAGAGGGVAGGGGGLVS